MILEIVNFDEVTIVETSSITHVELIDPSPMGNGQFFTDEFGFWLHLNDGTSKSFQCTYYDSEYDDLKLQYGIILQEIRNNKIEDILNLYPIIV
jgi:hypothetical protein